MRKIRYLNLLLILLTCIILAKIASDVVSHRLSHAFPPTDKKTVPNSAASPVEPISSYSPVLEKGMFGTATRGKLLPMEVKAGPGKPADSPSDLVLLGTSTGSFHVSFALFQKSGTREERVFKLGEKVFDLGRLVVVGKEFVEILVDGRRVKIHTPLAVPADFRKDKAATPGGYIIDQRVLNAALEDSGRAMTDARLLPSMKEGKVEGFRVSEVKPAGIFGMVGIKNGDILMRINDFSIDSPEKAVQSLVSLKGQNRIRLDLVRDGQPTTLNYEIR